MHPDINPGDIYHVEWEYPDKPGQRSRRYAIVIQLEGEQALIVPTTTKYDQTKHAHTLYRVEISSWREASFSLKTYAKADPYAIVPQSILNHKKGSIADSDLIKIIQKMNQIQHAKESRRARRTLGPKRR